MGMKKAQGAGSASILIVVIAAFILLYLLFLPPEERAGILNQASTTKTTVEKTIDANKGILLDERPGVILKTKQLKFEHAIPSFNLFTRTEDAVLKDVSSAYISSSKREYKTKTIPLVVKDGTKNVQLSLTVADHKGRLIIFLNGEEIFNGEVRGIFPPLKLEKLNDENVLEFATENVGWEFWRANHYELRDIKITGTVEQMSNQESRSTFLIGEDEARNMDEAYLVYLVDCRIAEVERLSIYLNDRLLSSKVPDCGAPVKIFIDPDDFTTGRNELRFFAEKGSYLIDQVFIKTKMKEPLFPVYFFEVNETQFSLVQNKSLYAVLTMKFVDDDERKSATININNFKTFMDTDEMRFNKTINTYLVEKTNFIRIEPENTMSIANLKVELK